MSASRVAPGKNFSLANIDPRDDGIFADKEAAKAQTAERCGSDRPSSGAPLCGGQARPAGRSARHRFQRQGRHRPRSIQPLRADRRQSHAVQGPERGRTARTTISGAIHKACPPRGFIGIFNRSHYEDVLVVKVKKFASARRRSSGAMRRSTHSRSFSPTMARAFSNSCCTSRRTSRRKRLQERINDPTKQLEIQSRRSRRPQILGRLVRAGL